MLTCLYKQTQGIGIPFFAVILQKEASVIVVSASITFYSLVCTQTCVAKVSRLGYIMYTTFLQNVYAGHQSKQEMYAACHKPTSNAALRNIHEGHLIYANFFACILSSCFALHVNSS